MRSPATGRAVAWAELAPARGLQAALSPRESARFGRRMARMVLGPGAGAGDVREALTSLAADIVIVRYDAGEQAVPALLVQPGWDVLAAAPIVYWSLARGRGPVDVVPPRLQVVARARLMHQMGGAGVAALVDRVVGASFSGYGTHYLTNPLLDAGGALAGYQEWARDSATAEGHELLALLADGEPVGITTLARGDLPQPHVEILLAGLVPSAQGQGWYAHLLAAAERLATDAQADRVVISTQVHNTGVQRAWCRFGFEPVGAYATVHLVREGLLAHPESHRPESHRPGGDGHGSG